MNRFISKINKRCGIFGEDGKYPTECWLWTANTNPDGYGMFWVKEVGDNVGAHRFSYELFIDKIPDGLTIDHLCRIRNCVNPDHLEVVTTKENILRGNCPAAIHSRKTHCQNGHKFTSDNTYIQPNGRGCLKCLREYQRKYQLQLRRSKGIGFERPRWTKEEEEIVMMLYSYEDKSIILSKLTNKTWKAVQSKANRLKLSRLRNHS